MLTLVRYLILTVCIWTSVFAAFKGFDPNKESDKNGYKMANASKRNRDNKRTRGSINTDFNDDSYISNEERTLIYKLKKFTSQKREQQMNTRDFKKYDLNGNMKFAKPSDTYRHKRSDSNYIPHPRRDGDDFYAFSNVLPNQPSMTMENTVIATILKLIDHKFDTLSSRISAIERAINGLQYYNVRQFRVFKSQATDFERGIRGIEARVAGLEEEFNRADFVSLRQNSQTTKYDVKTLAKNMNGMLKRVSSKIDKFNFKTRCGFSRIRPGRYCGCQIKNTKCKCHNTNNEGETTIVSSGDEQLDSLSMGGDEPYMITHKSYNETTADNPDKIMTTNGNLGRLASPGSISGGQSHVKYKSTTVNYQENNIKKSTIANPGYEAGKLTDQPTIVIHSEDAKRDTGPITYESLRNESYDINGGSKKHSDDVTKVNRSEETYHKLMKTYIDSKFDNMESNLKDIMSMLVSVVHNVSVIENKVDAKGHNRSKAIFDMFSTIMVNEFKIPRTLQNQTRVMQILEKSFKTFHDTLVNVKGAVDSFRVNQNLLKSKNDITVSKIESLTSVVQSYEVNHEQLSADLFTLTKSAIALESSLSANRGLLDNAISTNSVRENRKLEKFNQLSRELSEIRKHMTNVVGAVTGLTQASTAAWNAVISDLQIVITKLDNVPTNRRNSIPQRDGTMWVMTRHDYEKIANVSQASLTLVEAISRNTGWMPYVLDLVEGIDKKHNITAESIKKILTIIKFKPRYPQAPAALKVRNRRHHLSVTYPRPARNISSVAPDTIGSSRRPCGDEWTRKVVQEIRRILPGIRKLLIQSGTLLTLTNGTHDNEGRVEINHRGIWGSLCDVTLGQREADTVCRHLGYPGGTVARRGSFGYGSGPVWHIQAKCVGESRFDTDRCLSNGIESNSCSRSQAFAVRCEHQVRLSGYRVEVYHDHTWGSICSDGWSVNESMVTCRQLRHNRGVPGNTVPIDESTGPIWLSHVKCSGKESRLDQCRHSEWRRQACPSGQLAGVACLN